MEYLIEITESERRHILRLVKQELAKNKNSVAAMSRLYEIIRKLKL